MVEAMDVKIPSPSKILFNKPARQGSLYDETPLIGKQYTLVVLSDSIHC